MPIDCPRVDARVRVGKKRMRAHVVVGDYPKIPKGKETGSDVWL